MGNSVHGGVGVGVGKWLATLGRVQTRTGLFEGVPPGRDGKEVGSAHRPPSMTSSADDAVGVQVDVVLGEHLARLPGQRLLGEGAGLALRQHSLRGWGGWVGRGAGPGRAGTLGQRRRARGSARLGALSLRCRLRGRGCLACTPCPRARPAPGQQQRHPKPPHTSTHLPRRHPHDVAVGRDGGAHHRLQGDGVQQVWQRVVLVCVRGVGHGGRRAARWPAPQEALPLRHESGRWTLVFGMHTASRLRLGMHEARWARVTPWHGAALPPQRLPAPSHGTPSPPSLRT